MFIYAARQVHKKSGEKLHFCGTLNEALALENIADVKVVRFAGAIDSQLEREPLAAEQMRIDEICFAKRKSFAWRKLWPFARAA